MDAVYTPPKPAIIMPAPRRILRPGDPGFVAAAMIGGFGVTALCGGGGGSVGVGGNDSFTKLLLHCDGSNGFTTFTDSSSAAHAITASGNAQVSTAQSVFGGGSVAFDGAGDLLSSANSVDWNLGPTGGNDFTIDFRLRFASLTAATQLICALDAADTNGWTLHWNQSPPQLVLNDNGISGSTVSWSPSTNTWYHLAVVRGGTTITVYIDGTSIGTFTDINLNNDSNSLQIGGNITGTPKYLNGFMDEIRISKGIARWTTNFTPPTGPYS